MLELLKLILDGEFHSGEALGRQLGISRAAVWKQLQRLESEEYQLSIHKVRGRGYRLAEPLALLDPSRIDSSELGLQVVKVYHELDSTNAEALREVAVNAKPPILILAEKQSSGRGRRGRQWVSPFGQNIYYSLMLHLDQGASLLEGLSLTVGLAVLRTLREAGVDKVGLKWPNDLLVGDKKIAGILLEIIGDPADICHVVIGVGINVNMRADADQIDRPWTSTKLVTGRTLERNAFVGRLNFYISRYLSRVREKGFASLREEWEREHLWQGRSVRLSSGAGSIKGIVVGIDDHGALRLLVDGEERRCSGGELSLRLHNDS